SSGKFANKAVETLNILGATNMAFFFEKALKAVGNDFPEDLEERGKLLDEAITDGVREIFKECESAIEGDPDDFNALVYNYLINNRDKFVE
ncbi:MAG: DUF4375 domain-containing protein, partial [Dorea sp.]